jgi:hypothetical protein
MKATKSAELTIVKATFTERQTVGGETRAYAYQGFALRGWLNGQRLRKQFKTHSEALTAKERLELEAANTEDNNVRPMNTRLSVGQIATAETLFTLTSNPLEAVHFYLKHYRPPLVSVTTEAACADFMRDREGQVSVAVVVDYRKVTKMLLTRFPGQMLDTITTTELKAAMAPGANQERAGITQDVSARILRVRSEFIPTLGRVQSG